MGKIKKRLIYLSISNIFFYKLRSILLLFFFVVLFFTLEINQILIQTFDSSIENVTNMLGADLIVAPSGSSQKVIDAICTGKPSTLYFDEKEANFVYKYKGIKEINKRLMVASIDNKCCDTKVQFIGIDLQTDKQILSYIDECESFVGTNKIIIGHNIKYKLGDCPRFFGQIYNVVGRLKETGMGYDSSIFFDINQAERLFGQKLNSKVSTIFLSLDENNDVEKVKRIINRKLMINGLQAYRTSQMMTNISDGIKKVKVVIYFYSIIIFFICCISIYSVNFFDLDERKTELETYDMLGMSNKKKIELIVFEKFILVALSSLLGFIMSGIFILLLKNYLSLQSRLMINISAGFFLNCTVFLTLLVIIFEIITILHTVKRLFKTHK